MEVIVQYSGKTEFTIQARGHTIISDQPAEGGGLDKGLAPPELLLASLGSCVGYYAAQYLNNRKLSAQGMRIRVTAEKLVAPPRVGNFKIILDVPVELSAEDRQGIEKMVGHCLIHNTLQSLSSIEIELRCASSTHRATA